MKKLFLFSLIAVLFAACQTPVDETFQDEELMLKGAEKKDVCHWDADAGAYVYISIAEPAWYNGHGDHEMDKLAYSPEGEYVFKRMSGWDGEKYTNTFYHDINITSFDGTNFEGVGGFPASKEPGSYDINEVIKGTVIDGVLYGEMYYPNNDTPWTFQGTVSQCCGIVSLDETYVSRGGIFVLED